MTLFVSQVTVHYDQRDGAVIPKRVHTIVISVQHDDCISLEEQKKVLKEKVACRRCSGSCFWQEKKLVFNVESLLSGDQRRGSC